jgi:myo-inositol catabolism protein IolC
MNFCHELDALNQVIKELQKVAVDHEKDLSTLNSRCCDVGKHIRNLKMSLKSVLLVQMSNE